MKVITPVLLDVFLFYYYLNAEYRIKWTRKKSIGYILLLTCMSSLIVNSVQGVPFIQLFVYLLIMPLVVYIFYGNTWIKIATYLKLLLALAVIDLLSAYALNQIKNPNNENYSFAIFVLFTVVARILVYLYLKRRDKPKKINYFEITTYRYILIKGMIAITLLIADSYIFINEEILHTKFLGNMKILLLIILVVLIISIFEDIETEAQKVLKKMREEQQVELERNYLNVISSRTQELAKIRHDIKNHIFMISYLAEQDDIQGIKEYLGKIPIVEGNALITIPQKEWLGALVYAKAEKAKKIGIEFELENCWKPEQAVMVDNMDLLNLTANLLDNAIEATQKVLEKEKRKMGIILNQNKGYLMVDVWNYYNKDYLKIIGNKFRTTKSDKQLHGKGIEIIQEIVEKYMGDFSYSIEENKIIMKITIQNITVR